MNKANRERLENICRIGQRKLKSKLANALSESGYNVIKNKGFLFAKGDIPICLVAHMDTVHEIPPHHFVYSDGKLSSPQGIGGDDRCGIYAIMEIIKRHKCSVLFCEDEEVGAVGAEHFIESDISKDLDFNYMIELDRTGSNDAVFYDCDNPEFEEFIIMDGNWATDFGSFSDISVLAPALGCAAVNLSCGYYCAHTKNEYIVLDELEQCIENVCALIERTTEADKFEYIPAVYVGRYGYYGSGSLYGNNCYNDYEYRGSNFRRVNDEYSSLCLYYEICYTNENGKEDIEEVIATSEREAVGIFVEMHRTLTYNDIISVDYFGEGYDI